MQKKLVVVADDFTGATDTGVQFRKVGLKVKVIINTSDLSAEIEHCDVIVVDLESRLLAKDEAYTKSYCVGLQLLNIPNLIVYKKLDSTFRGNVGAEIDGIMDAMQLKITLLAPAYPACGRTTENGEVFVHNIKLANTEVINDPRTPVRHSRIADIIATQSKRLCSSIPTDFFCNGSQRERSDYFLSKINGESEILIFDSRNENDLKNITTLIDSIDNVPFLLAGSAGFANHLSKTLFAPGRITFVFAGSISENTRIQIIHTTTEKECRLIFIEGEILLSANTNTPDIISTVSKSIVEGNTRFIFTTALKQEDVTKFYQYAGRQGLLPEAAAGKLSVEMGRLAATLINEFSPLVVFLTGGETAINTVGALGATGIEIDREILPGIQSGTFTGCAVKSIIVTKAGAFGEPDAISKTFEFLNA